MTINPRGHPPDVAITVSIVIRVEDVHCTLAWPNILVKVK